MIPSTRRPVAVALVAALALAAAGLLTLRSAGLVGPASSWSALWGRQSLWIELGIVAALLAARADVRRLAGRPALLLHGALVLATVAATTLGPDGHGHAHRWLQLGKLVVQPSEPLKLSLILALASWLRRPSPAGARTPGDLAVPAAIVACTAIPVLSQPDLGTSLVLGLVAATMLALEPLSRWVKVLSLAMAAIVPAYLAWGIRDYHRARFLAWLSDTDPSGVGYQSGHALRVAGAGGLFGRGTGSFAGAEPYPLPAAHSDFVLSVWAHEHGLAGTLVLLGLLLAIVVGALAVASRSRPEDRFGVRVAVGVAALFFWQTALNAGMVLGLLPVVGVPLPLVSYGGSSAVTCLIALGLLVSVARDRLPVTAGAPPPRARPRSSTTCRRR